MVAKGKSETAAGTDAIEQSQLYKKYQAGLNKLPKPQRNVLNAAFITLRNLARRRVQVHRRNLSGIYAT